MAVLRAALVTPLSGALARYGEATAAALDLWAKQAADLPPRWRRVELDVRDSRPDPAAAIREAVAGAPHVVFGPYGSGPATAVLDATDRVVWNHGGASSRLAWPEFAGAINVLAPASTYLVGALQAVRAAAPDAGTVALLHVDTRFGRDVASGAGQAARRLGFDVHEVRFPAGDAAAAASRVGDADVLLVAAGFDDELTAARQLLARPWRAAAFVGAGVEEVLAELGEAREGLLGPAQWLPATAPQPDEGPAADWFRHAYRSAAGGEPAYPAVQAFAAGVLAARCLRDTGDVADGAQLAAAKRLRCTTLYGRFRLDPESGLQAGHRVWTVQWQDGARRAVWPPERAERPLRWPRPASHRTAP
ncbi:MAG TPA: ABC transporter substrate-binding protein [Egibacteraceae bacterium]|nr:ABC transporter substrate-binding protein [Egibacteraceae bacterium]